MIEPKEYLSRNPYSVRAMRYTPESADAVSAWIKRLGDWDRTPEYSFGGWFINYGNDEKIYYRTHAEFCKEFLVDIPFEEKNYE
jgi:hypothetical protein